MYINRFMRIFNVEDCVKLYLEPSKSNYFFEELWLFPRILFEGSRKVAIFLILRIVLIIAGEKFWD